MAPRLEAWCQKLRSKADTPCVAWEEAGADLRLPNRIAEDEGAWHGAQLLSVTRRTTIHINQYFGALATALWRVNVPVSQMKKPRSKILHAQSTACPGIKVKSAHLGQTQIHLLILPRAEESCWLSVI